LSTKDQDIIRGFLSGGKREHAVLVEWINEIARMKLRIKRVSAVEIISDTMYKLLSNFSSHSFQLKGNLKSYVQAVAGYTIIDHVRFWRRYTDLPETEAFDPPDPGSVEQDFEDRDQQTIAERIFRLMPEECRKLWHLRFVDDLDYAQIGAMLGISEGNVKVRFHRCKKHAIEIRKKVS
jgi:RNA polymerase sigma factor (sigma-70 family)